MEEDPKTPSPNKNQVTKPKKGKQQSPVSNIVTRRQAQQGNSATAASMASGQMSSNNNSGAPDKNRTPDGKLYINADEISGCASGYDPLTLIL